MFRAVSAAVVEMFRHRSGSWAGRQATRCFGSVASETGGINATPTAGRSLEDRVPGRRMSSTSVSWWAKVAERPVRTAHSGFCASARDARRGVRERTPRSGGVPWKGTKPKGVSGRGWVATHSVGNGLGDGARPRGRRRGGQRKCTGGNMSAGKRVTGRKREREAFRCGRRRWKAPVERRGGNGCGDAVRLSARERLRRV